MLELRFRGLYDDGGRDVPIPAVDVGASEFSIVVDGRTLYSEPHTTVVELASALTGWLQRPEEDRTDFEFWSTSTDERGLVWIKRANDGYRLGSIHQSYNEHREFSELEIRAAVEQFRASILASADETLDYDLRDFAPAIADAV